MGSTLEASVHLSIRCDPFAWGPAVQGVDAALPDLQPGLCLPDREVTSPAPCDMIGYSGSIAALVRCELISGPEFLLPPATASCWCRLLMLFERCVCWSVLRRVFTDWTFSMAEGPPCGATVNWATVVEAFRCS